MTIFFNTIFNLFSFNRQFENICLALDR